GGADADALGRAVAEAGGRDRADGSRALIVDGDPAGVLLLAKSAEVVRAVVDAGRSAERGLHLGDGVVDARAGDALVDLDLRRRGSRQGQRGDGGAAEGEGTSHVVPPVSCGVDAVVGVPRPANTVAAALIGPDPGRTGGGRQAGASNSGPRWTSRKPAGA